MGMTAKERLQTVIKCEKPDRVPVAPIRQEFCEEVGADFYGPDSTSGRTFARDVATGEA